MNKAKTILTFILVISMMLSQATFAFSAPIEDGSNNLPADYVDNSNEGLYKILDSLSDEIAPSVSPFSADAATASTAKVDIAFVIDSTGSMASYISNVKNNIATFAQYLSDMGVTLRVGIVEYRDIKVDGMHSTKVHTVSFSPWMNLTGFVNTLTTVSVGGGGDLPETPIDALGYLVDDKTMLWSTDAYKFAVLLTDASYHVDNRHGFDSLSEIATALALRNINTSVITGTGLYSTYDPLTSQTGGISSNIYSSNFSEELQALADKIMGSTLNAKKAIYVIPGFLGSELYDSTSASADKLWTDLTLGVNQVEHEALINSNSDGSSNGNFFAFGSDIFANGKDDYGTQNTYEDMVTALKEEFNDDDYDVKFFPYNWLGDINDTVKEIERDAAKYSKIVLITHSTGGLVGASYIAKSHFNQQKIEKVIMIAPPLYGTYASILPLERGDSKVGFAWIDMATNNKWVRQITHNSPTTYQLLPSEEYFIMTHALDLMTKDALWPWPNEWSNNVDWEWFYETLRKDDNNVNNALLDENTRSHRVFREQFKNNDRSFSSIIDVLRSVDTTIIGTAKGKSTPMTAQYDISKSGKSKLVDIKYNKDGDGTVYYTSLGLSLDEATDKFTSKLNTIYYNSAGPSVSWGSGKYNKYDHTGLVKAGFDIDRVSKLIRAAASKSTMMVSFSAANDIAPFANDPVGMEPYVKLRVESDEDVEIKVLDNNDNLVAYCYQDEKSGFDGDDFICNQFGDDGETLTSIYLPKEGCKVGFYAGTTSGSALSLSVQVNLLDEEGDITGYGGYSSDVTVTDGEIFTLDMTNGVDNNNLNQLASTADYPGLAVIFELFDAGWELDFSSVNIHKDVVVLDTIGAKATVGISGSINPTLIFWHSSDESVVTVTNGTITATGNGRTIISASAMDGSGKSKQFPVKVTLSASSIDFDDVDLVIGERSVINPIYPSDRVTEKQVDYDYDEDAGIIAIEDGVVFGLALGTIEVTGIAAGGAENTFQVSVSDNAVLSVQNISISPASKSILVGEKITLTATINPDDATNKGINWFVEDEEVVSLVSTMDKATITGLKEGTTKVTAVSVDGGYIAEAAITVTDTNTYTIKATAGTGGTVTGGGVFAKNTNVTLTATANSGYRFDGWYEGGTKVSSSATYSFAATANRTLGARFTYAGSGGGGGGGRTSYTSPALNISEVKFDKSAPKDITVTISSGSYSFRDIKNGDNTLVRDKDYTVDGNTYTIKADYLATLKAGETTLTFIMSGGTDPTLVIMIETNTMTITSPTTDNDGILLNGKENSIILNADGSVTISADDLSGLTAPVLLTLPCKDEGITHTGVLKKGGQSIIIPYSVYKDSAMIMLVSEPGTYSVISNKKTFTDTSGHWAANTIDFITSREIYSGVGNNKFDPNRGMTRAMFAQVLVNLEGANLTAYSNSRFTDVENGTWYTSAVEWAADNGIVSGYSNNQFGPNDLITREQMAVMLNNYLNYKGIVLHKEDNYIPFSDAENVSSWAKDAVSDMKRYGLISGVGNNAYAPKDTANRASVAQIFRNFIEYYVK